MEVRSSDGTVIVLDCGTGAFELGRTLVSAGQDSLQGHILLTHTHWDHIQGIPFFEPLFTEGNAWHVYGAHSLTHSLRETLATAMSYTYFPVTLDQLAGVVGYHDLMEGTFEIGDIRVTTRYLNHTVLTLGYRLEIDGVVIVYVTDHEPHNRKLATGSGDLYGEDWRHAQFVAGADLLIHDAQYLAKEYPAKVSWGHSTVEYVLRVAGSADVRRVALFHHDPLRSDDEVDRIVEVAQNQVAVTGNSLEVFAAFENQVLEFESRTPTSDRLSYGDSAVVTGAPSVLPQQTVLLAVHGIRAHDILSDAIREDNLQLLLAHEGDSVLRLIRSERPSLLILDRYQLGRDGLEICRALREAGDSYGKELPVILVASQEYPDDVKLASDLGASDWLIMPFTHAYARAKIHMWMLRSILQCNKVSF